jgi:hypothetical protein
MGITREETADKRIQKRDFKIGEGIWRRFGNIYEKKRKNM